MISINATLIVQVLNLLILIFILNRIMYKPLRRIMAERAEAMEKGREEAKTAQGQAREGEERYNRELTEGRLGVRAKLKELLDGERAKGQQLIQEKQAAAQAEYQRLVTKIQDDMVTARQDVRKEAEAVAKSMAVAVLGREA